MIADLEALPLTTRWLGHQRVLLADTASTNDEAMRRGREGAPHGFLVVADTQSRGRGRQGHAWHSPPGDNLYLSVVLRLELPPMRVPPVTLATGVAVCDTVNGLGVHASLKWPNDVLVDEPNAASPRGAKVAGILTEMSTRGMRADVVVVGIGLNVNTEAFPPELPNATSLRRARGGVAFERADVLARLLAALETRIDRFLVEPTRLLADAWRARSRIFGQRLRVTSDGATVEGVARELDDDGALVLETAAGALVRVIAGEVLEA